MRTDKYGNSQYPRIRKVFRLAVYSRILTLLLGAIFDSAIEDYDRTGHLEIPSSNMIGVLYGFAKWDGVYFLRIAQFSYEHEQMHAFFPGYPFLIRWLTYFFGQDSYESYVLSGLLISNICFIAAAIYLYKLSSLVLNEQQAFVSSVLFCFSACSVFMSAVYSESLIAFLTFFGWYQILKNNRFIACLIFALAATVKSTATFLLAALFPLLFRSNGVDLKGSLYFLFGTAGIFSVLHLYLTSSRNIYCSGKIPADWCKNGETSIYSYVQRKFWNVGLLRYWKLKNIPFFIVVLPSFWIACQGFLFPCLRRIHDNFRKTGICKEFFLQQISDKQFGFAIHLFACLFVTAFLANVQIFTRLVSSSPAYFWAQAFIIDRYSGTWLLFGLATLHCIYFLVGILLFCNFLPWT